MTTVPPSPSRVGGTGGGFTVESAEAALLRHFRHVERRDVFGTVRFVDRQAAYDYVAASRCW